MDHGELFNEDDSTTSPVVTNNFLHENEVRVTQVADSVLRTPTKVVNSSMKEPQVGMIFKTNEEALKFYETYGVSKGFSVVTRSSRKNWSRCDLFTSMTFACSHYGSYNKKIDDNVPIEKRRLNTSKGIYTRRAFEKFKRNWDRVEKYKSDVSSSDPNIHVVKYKMGVDEHWLVKLCPQTFEGSCECHFFEFVGIPCAHLLKVFSKLDMVEIPEFFVMKRWLKGANKYRLIDNEECTSKGRGNILELSQLCHEATQVACVAMKTKEGGKIYMDVIRELGEKINQLELIEPDKEVSPIILPCNDHPAAVLLDPNVTKAKGRPPNEGKEKKKSAKDARFKHPIEEAQGKKRRKCTGCDNLASHNRSTCPIRKAREASNFSTPSGASQNSSDKD